MRVGVPRINAATVAEHHSQRRAALIQAGSDLLASDGLDAVTLGAVGAATGLARTSVYQYFDSTPALVAAIVEDAFPRATEQLEKAVARATTPQGQIDRFVATALDLATDPTHRSLYALSSADLPSHCRARVAELHASQYAPLLRAVAEIGVSDAELTTRLIGGLVQAAAQAIASGSARSRVQARTLALIHSGLAAPE